MPKKMEDIAKLAGVSVSAVSIAINGKKGISQATREKIFKVINENDYQPLRKRKKGGLRKVVNCDLIIVNDKKGVVNRSYHTLPFFDHLVTTLTQNINGFGANLRIDTLRITHLAEDLRDLLSESAVTNAIVLGTELSAEDISLIDSQIKNVVFVDTYYSEIDADFVTTDNFQGAYQAAKYLLEKGFTEIGYAATSKNNPNFLQRRAGFRAALAEVGIEINTEHFYKIDAADLVSLKDLKGFSVKKLPQVIFCDTDYMAIRIMKECRNNNLVIPRDLSVMGFDDIEEASLVNPELTTVHASVDQIINQAIYQLQAQISQEDWEAQKCLVGTHIVERNTVKLK